MNREMTDTLEAAIKRLRRKAEIMKLDLKAKNYAQYHDANEILSLVDIIEREVSK